MKPYLISHLLEQSALKWPDKIAVKHKKRTITFAELYNESLKLKGYLLATGVQKGERVGILLDKSIEQLVSLFGTSMAGAVFVFLNPILKEKQIEYIINDCQIKLVITTSKYHRKNKTALSSSILCMDEPAPESSLPSWSSINDTIRPDETGVYQIADDTACLIYTSGSTGMPKGVVVPHRTVVDGAEIVSSYLSITDSDRLISVLPFNFDYGLNQATSAILKGATLVLHHFFLANDLLKVLQEERITGFAGMNPIWLKLFHEKFSLKSEYDFSHLRYITNTGGKVPRSIVSKLQAFFPHTNVFLMYGLTEAFRSTFLPPNQLDQRPDSMGKAIPNVEILVVNDQGEECAPGEPGELVHRGALVTKGYWNDSVKTNKVFRNNPLLKGQDHLNETVVYSGDLVKKDEEGFLYFISRNDQMIKTSGYRVSPTEVEEVLIEIPGVNNAVVFGRENENAEQLIVAIIETSDVTLDKGKLLQECRKQLPGYMVPAVIHFEKVFRKTANDKIDRSSIKQKWSSPEAHDET